jgi:hypothetical protein
MQQAASVLAMTVAGVPGRVDAVRNGDDFNPSWETGGVGVPRGAYVAGLNLLGMVNPGANNASYPVVATVVENAPLVGGNNNSFLQCGREDYMAILDYAQHVAALQMGGSDFMQTIPLLQRFHARAALYNSKLSALGEYEYSMADQTQTEAERNPVFGAKKPADVLGS